MAAIPTDLTEGGVLAELLTGGSERFAADPTVAGWGDLIQKIQTEGSGGEVPTTKNKAGVTDAKYVEAGMMTPQEFIDKWGVNHRDYEDLPQAFIQSGDTQFASGDVKKQDYDNLEEKYKREYDEYMNPKDPLGVPIKLASADTGAAPIGTYKGGDTGAAPIGTYKGGDTVVEPIGPADDTDAERIWQNMLNKSEDQPVSVLSPQEQGRLDVNDALLNAPTNTIQLPPKVTAGVDLDDKGIYGLSGGLNIPRGEGMFTGGVNVGLPYNIDTPFGVQQVDPTLSGRVGYQGKNIGVNINYQPRGGGIGMGGNMRF